MRFLDGLLGTGVDGQAVEAAECMGPPRIYALVRALFRGTLARMADMDARYPRPRPAFRGHVHQRIDRGRGDQSTRLAGGRAAQATRAAARPVAAVGEVDALPAGASSLTPAHLQWVLRWTV